MVLPSRQLSSDNSMWKELWRKVVPKLSVPGPSGPTPMRVYAEWEEVFDSPSPNLIVVGGEGSGKSLQGAAYLTARTVYDLMFGPQLYWIVGRDFEDARKDLDYFVDMYRQIGEFTDVSLPTKPDNPAGVTTDTGHRIQIISSYDPLKIAREEPMGIVGAEVSRWEMETLSRCEGRLLRKYPNSWGFFGGSPESSIGWFADTIKYASGPNERHFRSFKIPSWCNASLYPGGREDPAIKRAEAGRSPQKFLERFGAEFTPPKGLVCHTFRYNLHIDHALVYDPMLPVYIAIDPGSTVYAVLFIQLTDDGEVRVLDEIYVHRWPHEEVLNEFKSRPLHGAVVGGSIDIASTQRQNAMPHAYDEWHKETGLLLYAEKHSVDDSVDRLLWALANNPNTGRARLRIHPSCTGIISEMGGGVAPVPDGGPWMRYSTPQNQWGPPMRKNDHACKALAYLLGGPHSQVAHDRKMRGAQAVSYVGGSARRQNRRGGNSYLHG